MQKQDQKYENNKQSQTQCSKSQFNKEKVFSKQLFVKLLKLYSSKNVKNIISISPSLKQFQQSQQLQQQHISKQQQQKSLLQKIPISYCLFSLKLQNYQTKYRIYDFSQFKVIDGLFIDNHCYDAVVYCQNKVLQNASIKIEQILQKRPKTPKFHKISNKIKKITKINQNYPINTKIQIQQQRQKSQTKKKQIINIFGLNVKEKKQNNKIRYQGGYQRSLRHGFGKLISYSSFSLKQNQQQEYQISQGLFQYGVKKGYFLNYKKRGQKIYQFDYGFYENQLQKGIHYFYKHNWSFLINYNKIPEKQRFQLQLNKYQQQTDVVESDNDFQNKFIEYRQQLFKQIKNYQTNSLINKKYNELSLTQTCTYFQITKDQLLKRTQKNQMLSNSVCNAFFKNIFRLQFLLKGQLSQFNCQQPQTYIFPLDLMEIITQQKYQYKSTKKHLKIFQKQHNFFNGSWKQILFPYACNDKNHFILIGLFINYQNQKNQKNIFQLKLFDSMSNNANKREKTLKSLQTFLKDYIEQISNDFASSSIIKTYQLYQFLQKMKDKDQFQKVSDEIKIKQLFKSFFKTQIQNLYLINQNVPKQNDGYSCGVFMCYFIQMLTKRQPINAKKKLNPNQYRKYIRQLLMQPFNEIDLALKRKQKKMK